jgi:hypothetical protein
VSLYPYKRPAIALTARPILGPISRPDGTFPEASRCQQPRRALRSSPPYGWLEAIGAFFRMDGSIDALLLRPLGRTPRPR